MAIKSISPLNPGDPPSIFVEWNPLQVCVVCDVTCPTADDETEGGPIDKLYGQVRDTINTWLERTLGQPQDDPATQALYAAEPKLAPKRLLEQAKKGNATTVERIVYPSQDDPLLKPVPWIFLSESYGKPPFTLFFYTINPIGLPSEDRARLQESLDRVSEVANLVNWNLIARGNQISDACWKVRAAHPNWLFTSAPVEGGSPGAQPELAPAGQWLFSFEDSNLNFPPDNQDDADVFIAVLDTSPPQADILGAATQELLYATTTGGAPNALLQQISQNIQLGGTAGVPVFTIDRDDPGSILRTEYTDFGLDDLLPDWGHRQPKPGASHESYLMPDHGLFVAGIIRSIAPYASIRLIRVLNDYGLGDLRLVASVLKKLPTVFADTQKSHMVVNLSLGSDVPPGVSLLQIWCPTIYKNLTVDQLRLLAKDFTAGLVTLTKPGEPLAALGSNFCQLLELTDQGLSDVITWLSTNNPRFSDALVVAAAGNDSDDLDPQQIAKGIRPEPRYPAHYENVLGVAALNYSGGPSRFSNRGDEPNFTNGVATFGGDARRTNAGDLPHIAHPGDRGIVGVFSRPIVPLQPLNLVNLYRWVAWAGTSFSTPIISAIAAKLWGANPGFNSQGLLTAIRNQGTGNAGDPLSTKRIVAHQNP